MKYPAVVFVQVVESQTAGTRSYNKEAVPLLKATQKSCPYLSLQCQLPLGLIRSDAATVHNEVAQWLLLVYVASRVLEQYLRSNTT